MAATHIALTQILTYFMLLPGQNGLKHLRWSVIEDDSSGIEKENMRKNVPWEGGRESSTKGMFVHRYVHLMCIDTYS